MAISWEWTVSGGSQTGKLTLKEGTAKLLIITGVSATKVSPLFSGEEATEEELAALFDVSGEVVTIKDESVFYKNDTSGQVTPIELVDVLDESKYTGTYKLAVASSVTADAEKEQTLGSTWTINGTTATNTATVDNVYALNEGKTKLYRSVDYTVTVDGLASSVATSDLTESDGTITIGTNGLADGITVTTALKDTEAKNVPTTVDYELEVATGEGKASVDYAWYQKPKAADVTLYQTVTGGENTYYSEGTVIKQIKDKSATEGKETELCTVTGLGLDKNTDKEERADADVTGIEVKMKGGTNGVLVVNSGLLDLDDPLKKLQIKGQGSFKFEFAQEDADLEVHEITEDKAEWVVSKGKAVLTGGMSKGYTLSSDGKTLTYTKEKPNAIATISGFKKDANADALASALAAVTEDGVVTLDETILNSNYVDETNPSKVKIALKNGKDSNKQAYDYKLELDPDSGFTATGTWTLGYKEKNGANIPTGKAIYTGSVTAGYSISGGTITAAGDQTNVVLVELSGLNVAKLTEIIEEMGENFTWGETDDDILRAALALEDGKFTLQKYNGSNIFDTKKVSIKNKIKGVEFGLAVGNENANTDLGQVDDVTTWTVDSKTGTAKYYIGKSAGYVVDEKKGTTATFTQPGTDDITTTLATLSSLPKTATVDDFDVEDITDKNNPSTVTGQKIVLQKSLFNGLKKETTIKLTNGKDAEGADCTYTLGVAEDLNTNGTDKNYLNVEKGKATYVTGTPEYWDISTADEVTYKPAGKATKTYATVSGLNKEATKADVGFNETTGVFTVNKAAIDTSEAKLKKTKITLKLGKDVDPGTYKLALNEDTFEGSGVEVLTPAPTWDTTSKKGKAIYQLNASGNGLVCDGTTISYAGDGGNFKPTALATLSNVSTTAPGAPDENSGVIKLASANLVEGKKATLGKKDPYVLALHAGDSAAKATGTWDGSATAVTLKGKQTAGHAQKDNFTIDVVKATKTNIDGIPKKAETLAEIKGTALSLKDVAVTDKSTIELTADKLGTGDLEVDGKGIFGFSFSKGTKTTTTGEGENPQTTTEEVKLTGITITGKDKNDSFTFDGGVGLTIDTKAGNDYVKLGDADRSNAADTFVYASGDGYDEVADFTARDYLEIKGAKKIEVNQVSGGNTYISVDKGTTTAGVITLDSFSYSALDISGLGADDTVKLIAPDYDFDSTNAVDHVALTEIILGKGSTNYESGYSSDSFDKSFTLSSENAFTAKISFTKKTT